jgi:hypothetical protein
MNAPLRLLDDPAAPAALRADLARLRGAASGFDVDRGLRAFDARLAALSAAPAVAAAGATGTMVGGAIAGALLALAVVGAAVGVSAYHDRQARPAAAAAPSAPAPPAAGVEVAPAPLAPLPEATRPPAALPASSTPASPRASPTAPVGEDGLAGEIEDLQRAWRLVGSSPAEALALAEAGHRRFPHGQLYPEREMVAITALYRLGRRAEARARADRFLAAHPGSPFGERLRKLESGEQ